ncbi:MAG: deoxyguanosinetriphosphate triphosphohydrolase, partial [Planctomycetes bacterium]|nr:deoxyguanosinetriphosphate triphosphohydrolase [Planctomycetota bacterium]
MFSREDLEKREERELAPYAMRSRQTRGRKHPEEEHPFRGVYQRDRDRVIYSTAFRRLQYKTQVFVNHEGDYYRTRLTHTLEVSQISRTIARSLNLNEDLVEAIALSHDLGHTPFAHSGEEALKKLMKDHGGFEHNRHGLRVVDLLETRYPGFPGLNLTYEVREAIAKHSTTYDSPLIGEFDLRQQPTLEAQIVERADEIAYDSHDLDDGVTAGLVSEADLDKVALWHYAAKKVAERYADLTLKERKYQTVRFLINMEVTDLIQRTQANIQKKGLGSAEDVRRCPERIAGFSAELHEQKTALEAFLMENVYRHYRVARMANKARHFVERLFEAYVANPRQLPPD